MTQYEVPEPIINSPFDEPAKYWHIAEGEPPDLRDGRRPAMYYYRDPKYKATPGRTSAGVAIELILVNRIRQRVSEWRKAGYAGVSRTTAELLAWWRRDGREKRLFFAQLEAAETIIFLAEARADLRQGVNIPVDEPGPDKQAEGYKAFVRYACKMATGAGKTTVMGMLAAWSILNKVNNKGDARFSDAVLVVCPNVTIRNRLQELDPELGEASLYRTRDLVPPHLMKFLSQGKVLVRNWHVFEPKSVQTGGERARVVKAGVPMRKLETISISSKTTTARGRRYLTLDEYQKQLAAGLLDVKKEERDGDGSLKTVQVESLRYIESDASLLAHVLGRDIGGKQNLLVMNDEAHHAYRIKREEPDEEEEETFGEDEDAEEYFKEATVWIEGLDRVHKLRGINLCIDLSATPYFLGRVGQETNRPFPWVVSDFGLVDAIESGLVKIPQLAVRDTTGAEIPGYFNIWHWILPKLTAAERGGKRSDPKPEAILKYAHHPIAMLGGLWEEKRQELLAHGEDLRPPVFIIVCKNTKLAKVVYEWLGEDKKATGIPPSKLEGFRNRDGQVYTIRVDSKVVHETDSGESKGNVLSRRRPMPFALMWFLIALVAVTGLLCNSAAWLWMAAKWCRIPNVSYLRALATMSLITVINLLLQSVYLVFDAQTSAAVALLALYAVVATVCIRQVLRTTTRRALAAGLISMFISSIVAIAFVIPFRLYIMESFVVPSGSMALAVIGRHFDVSCERCGRTFSVSAVDRYQNQQRGRGDATGGFFAAGDDKRQQVCRCPNCRSERALADNLPTAAGDKILVDKIGFPRRWEVAVFRLPDDVSVIYLKRLVGLPGEKLEIIAGDVFINDRREAKPFGVAHDLWIPVNDTRFHPGELNADDPQWKPEPSPSHWRWDQRGWTFSGFDVDPQELVFSGPTTDESFYSERWSDEPLPPDERPLELGDLQVKCMLTRFSGNGPLGFRWTFRGLEATASVSGSGDIELRSDHGRQQAHLPQPLSEVKIVAFAVRDGIVMLVADGQALATLAVGPQDAARCRAADESATEPCRIAITAGHCDLELAGIVLERDVYYRSIGSLECTGCTGHPIALGPQEHYVLGDHSIRANDSRVWQTVDASLGSRFQKGTVPFELMIGVVRCIYWPPARWRAMR